MGSEMCIRDRVPDLAWPVPSHRHGRKRPSMDTSDIVHMSQWLKDAELPVAGVETSIDEAKE